jgi:hypothetical protein
MGSPSSNGVTMRDAIGIVSGNETIMYGLDELSDKDLIFLVRARWVIAKAEAVVLLWVNHIDFVFIGKLFGSGHACCSISVVIMSRMA